MGLKDNFALVETIKNVDKAVGTLDVETVKTVTQTKEQLLSRRESLVLLIGSYDAKILEAQGRLSSIDEKLALL